MNQLATDNKPRGLRAWFDVPSVKTGIRNALGGWMNEDSFIAQLVISLQDQNLDACSDESKFEAAHLCAALGMLPSLQQVALIPRNSKKHGRKICTVMPQWQGFQALMLRNNDVLDVNADLVHVNDEYEFDPVTRQLKHSYDPFDDDRSIKTFDDIKGGYLVVKWKDKSRPDKFHFVTKNTIIQARDCSPDYQRNSDKGAIWNKWFREQCLKTVYRNTYARRVIPIDPLVAQRMEKIIEAEDTALENDPNRTAEVEQPKVIETTGKTQSRSELVSSTMKQSEANSEPPPETKHSEVADTFDTVTTEMNDVTPVNEVDTETETIQQVSTEPPQKKKQSVKPMQKVPLYKFLQKGIDTGDGEVLEQFLERATASLDANFIKEDEYNVWTEMAQDHLERLRAPS